jgi:hypothetical protein
MMPDEQTATPERGGIFTCPKCAQFYSRTNDWERKFWKTSALIVAAIGPRSGHLIPGTQITWADAFESITQVPFSTAQERAAHDRALRKAKA